MWSSREGERRQRQWRDVRESGREYPKERAGKFRVSSAGRGEASSESEDAGKRGGAEGGARRHKDKDTQSGEGLALGRASGSGGTAGPRAEPAGARGRRGEAEAAERRSPF